MPGYSTDSALKPIRQSLAHVCSIASGCIAPLTAIACGAVLSQLAVAWITLVGPDPIFLGTLLVGMSLGVFAASRVWSTPFLRRIVEQPSASTGREAVAGLLTAVLLSLTWSAPVFLQSVFQLVCQHLLPSVTAVSSAATIGPSDLVLALLLPAVLMGLFTLLTITWAACLTEDTSERRPRQTQSMRLLTWLWWGSVGGCLLLVHSLTAIPVAATVSVCLSLSYIASIGTRRWAAATRPFPTTMAGTETGIVQPGARLFAAGSVSDLPVATRVATAGIAFSGGLVALASLNMLSRLIEFSCSLMFLSLFVALMMAWLMGRPSIARRLPSGFCIWGCLLMISMLPWMSAMLFDWNLALRSAGAAVAGPVMLQAAQVAVILLCSCCPVWMAVMHPGNALAARTSPLAPDTGSTPSARENVPVSPLLPGNAAEMLLMAVLGCMGFWILTATGMPLSSLFSASLAVLAICCLLQQRSPQRFPRMFRMATVIPAGLILTICLPGAGTQGDAARSRMMFSDRTLKAVDLGLSDELLAHSEAARLIRQTPSVSGMLQVWRKSAQGLEFRSDGRLLGQISSDSRLSPQPVEEILPAIVPLVAHPQPNRILILGDATGSCLKICSHFPVQRIVAIRQDRRLTKLAHEFTWSHSEHAGHSNVTSDDRVEIRHASSSVALHQTPDIPFDVVISAQPAQMTLAQAGQFTEQYYQAARAQLSPAGVFCQRLSVHHLDPQTIRQILATSQTAFRHVLAIQTVPGEFLVLASNTPEGMLREHLLRRLQQDYVRQEIATAGWDWSQVAILPMLDTNDPVGLFSSEPRPPAFSLANSQLTLQLPLALQRSSDWHQQMHAAFSASQIRIGEAVPMGESQHEIKRRLTALSQQVEILAGMPDEPWTYRRSLRMEMQRSARPPKEIISHGKVTRTAHPTDQHHRQYFQTLGASLQRVLQGDHSESAFSALNNFTQTCEPLVSLFAHYELARLHELAEHPAPAAEFNHRLHTVNFTEPSDASVRPVVAALQQLVARPELIPTDADRYDQLNALVQKLIERWEARTAWEPRSAARVQNDVDRSVHATQRAMEMMEQLADSAGIPRDEFLLRRRFINSALVGPLRSYRDQVLAHRMKHARPAEIGDEDPDDLPLLLNPADLSASQEISTN